MTFVAANLDYVARQRADPHHAAAARGADLVLADLGVAYRTLPYLFRIDAGELAELERATVLLADALDTVVEHVVGTHAPEELDAMFAVPPAMAAQLDWPTLPKRGMRAMRADIIPTATGYAFCEINHFCAVGAGDAFYSAVAYGDLIGRPVAGISPMRQQAVQYAEHMRAHGMTRFVILDSVKHRPQGFGEHVMLQRTLRWLLPDVELHYCDEHTFRLDWLTPEEAARTLVHRLTTFDDTEDEGAFLVRLRDAGVTMACMFESEVRMHRRWFSLLCDPQYQQLLRAEEVEAIRRYVPYSYDLTADGVDDAVAEKDGFVFKRSWSYGGRDVVVGAECPAEELRSLLAVDPAGWNCQRRVVAETMPLTTLDGRSGDYRFALGMFLYGDGPSGLLVRASGETVVNVSRGGGVSWAFA